MNVILRNPAPRIVLPVVKSPKVVMIRSGSSGGDKNFVFVQGTPSNTWVIAHGLSKYPSVSVMDSAGTEVEGDVHYDSVNQVTIQFNAAFGGTATLN